MFQTTSSTKRKSAELTAEDPTTPNQLVFNVASSPYIEYLALVEDKIKPRDESHFIEDASNWEFDNCVDMFNEYLRKGECVQFLINARITSDPSSNQGSGKDRLSHRMVKSWEQGWTAFFFASEGSHAELMTLLLQHGAKINEIDVSGRTVLYKKADQYFPRDCSPEDVAAFELLLKHGADARIGCGKSVDNLFQSTALHSIVVKGNKALFDVLLNVVAPEVMEELVRILDWDGRTPLNAALHHYSEHLPKDLPVVRQIIDVLISYVKPWEVNHIDMDGYSLLYLAYSIRDYEWVQKLLDMGADPTMKWKIMNRPDLYRNTVFEAALVWCLSSYDILRMLLTHDNGKYLNVPVYDKYLTALMYAVKECKKDLVFFIVDTFGPTSLCIDQQCNTMSSWTAMHYCMASLKRTSTVPPELLAGDDDTDDDDDRGVAAAADENANAFAIAQILIDAGARWDIKGMHYVHLFESNQAPGYGKYCTAYEILQEKGPQVFAVVNAMMENHIAHKSCCPDFK